MDAILVRLDLKAKKELAQARATEARQGWKMNSRHRPLAMAMRDATAEACVAYLLAQLVSNGRDPAEAVLLVHPADINWMRPRLPEQPRRPGMPAGGLKR